ncbi:MAG TPA: FAD-dependent monooxygenase [Isosphaeraceae bacterium]|jgi:2-polyprenyl-6-methoxyphenol hydroxylase-like FAD-dependent oxidoreductase|nr:FAD-dependent monooxygenase [Isosphaeraceae bacterium]
MTAATLDLDGAGERCWDVVVIGAGPAGALAARQVAAGRSRVLLLDRKTFPRPKVCGACLNGTALAVLGSVGLGDLVDRLGGIDLERLDVGLAGRLARFPLPAGKALAREVFDAALVDEALAAGADFLPATTATVEPGGEPARTVQLDRQGQRRSVEASVVVVAAGLAGSCLEHEPRMLTRVAAGSRVGAGCTVAAYPSVYGEGTIYMAVGRSGYVGLVRVGGELLNIAAAFDRNFVRASGGPEAAAAAVLDEAGFTPVPALADAPWQGTVGLTRQTRPVASHRLFLVGDAAGYVEPFTGEGMGAALTSARAVAPLALRGVSAWDASLVAAWKRQHYRLVGRHQLICRGLAVAARHPWVARGVFGLATWSPAISGELIRRVNEPHVLIEAR